jgi:class 3 adenylate cyclase
MRELPTGTVTLLFAEIEESPQLQQQLGERYNTMQDECSGLLRDVFQKNHGHEVNTQDEVFFMAFARATDAVVATTAAQRALFTHSWPEGIVL